MVANLSDAIIVINEQKNTIAKLRVELANSGSRTGSPGLDGSGERDATAIFLKIESCSDCPYASHSGAFTKGGAKPLSIIGGTE